MMRAWRREDAHRLAASVAMKPLLAVTVLLGAFQAAAQNPAMLVYLPGVLNQSPQEVAAAVTSLGAALAPALAQKQVDASLYRRPEDALAFLQAEGPRVALVLCDAPFLLDLPQDSFVPVGRFVVAGSETYRKLVVAKADGRIKRLADLKERAVSVVPVPRTSRDAYLARMVFDDLFTPASWFSRMDSVPDDFAATASVLYGGLDAAIVSERNPLLASKLGSELNAVHASAPLSLPVLAVRRALLTPGVEQLLAKALESLSRSEHRAILGGLRIDALRTIPDAERTALTRPPVRRSRPLELVLPEALTLPAPEASAPKAQELPFVAAVPIPDVPVEPSR